MNDFIKTMYARVILKFKNSSLDKKEILRRYRRRYKCIDMSKDCINSRLL